MTAKPGGRPSDEPADDLRMDLSFVGVRQIAALLAEQGVPARWPRRFAVRMNQLGAALRLSFAYFDDDGTEKLGCVDRRRGVEIGFSERGPRSWIGELQRPLFFSDRYLERCRDFWAPRSVDTFFAGTLHDHRRRKISAFYEAHGVRFPALRRRTEVRLRKRLAGFGAAGRWAATFRRDGHLVRHVVQSGQGPAFWDDEYHATLGQSGWVFCAPAYQDWNYRFFEAVACGAVPIADPQIDAYAGYRFATYDGEAAGIRYGAGEADRAAAAEHNLVRLREQCCVDRSALLNALGGAERTPGGRAEPPL